MLLLLLTGNCVYVCMYVYIYPKWWFCVFVRVFPEQGTRAAAGTEAETEISALASTESCCWTQLLTCTADKNILPPAPANVSALWPFKPGWAADTWLLLLHPQLPLGPSSDQEQALGTCISCLLNLRYEKGHGRALGGHRLAPPGHALSSKPSRFSHGGTATIHLWLCSSAPSLLTLQMNIL